MSEMRTTKDQEEQIWPHVAEKSEDNAAIQSIRARAETGELTVEEVAATEFGHLLTTG